MTEPSFATEVLGCMPAPKLRFTAVGAVLALWLHGGLLVALALSGRPRPAVRAARPMRVEFTDSPVALPAASTVQRGVVAAPPSAARPAALSAKSAAPPRPADRPPPPPPRATATSPAAAPSPPEIVDFTAPGAGAYVGGTHSQPGSAPGAAAAVGAPQGDLRGGGSLARNVGLEATEWRCPWPAEAEGLDIHTQVVVLRAVVNERGKALHVNLLVDPGHGFGSAALTCAAAVTFEPARGRDGTPYAATSPPIRVTFTREAL